MDAESHGRAIPFIAEEFWDNVVIHWLPAIQEELYDMLVILQRDLPTMEGIAPPEASVVFDTRNIPKSWLPQSLYVR